MTRHRETAVALALAIATLFNGAAKAASFDCGAAKSRIERLICGDKILSRSDSDLSLTYKQALDLAADVPSLIASQRAWMKERDHCANTACLFALYSERAKALKATPRAGWKTYRDARFGISFEYLGNRGVIPCGEGYIDCVKLVGHGMGLSDYLMRFQFFAKPLERAAHDENLFERRNGRWMTIGVMNNPSKAAEPLSGPGWAGVKSVFTCGISDPETGFHAGAGACYWAVVSDGRRSVVVDTEGLIGDDPATTHSVLTLKFER